MNKNPHHRKQSFFTDPMCQIFSPTKMAKMMAKRFPLVSYNKVIPLTIKLYVF